MAYALLRNVSCLYYVPDVILCSLQVTQAFFASRLLIGQTLHRWCRCNAQSLSLCDKERNMLYIAVQLLEVGVNCLFA